ncbi:MULTISPECIES: hypothetical protein [unclassified Kribbella]|uniref:hypothetical protein n=1 Tax=unclassified Kribbella TaxID=2644121 RepID=UPI0030164E22
MSAEDEWSDVDLALGLAPDADQDAVLADWTASMYSQYGALHHTDVWSRGTVDRVFCWLPRCRWTLVCLRHGVPHSQGRGLHLLPAATTAPLEATLVQSLEAAELTRAFSASVDVLLAEIAHVDADLAVRLDRPLRELAWADSGW